MTLVRQAMWMVALLSMGANACGRTDAEDVDPTHQPGPPIQARPAVPEPILFRVALSGATDDGHGALIGGSVQVVAVDLQSATATPFGPPVPVPADTGYVSVEAVAAPRGRVAVCAEASVYIDSSGTYTRTPSLVLVGDGVTWREVRRVVEPVNSWEFSADGSLVALASSCPGNKQVVQSLQVFDLDGASLLQTECSDDQPYAGFAPDSSYFAHAENGKLGIRSREGAALTLAAVGTDLPTVEMFPTSLVVRSANGNTVWFDRNGTPLVVPGFAFDGRFGGGKNDNLPPFQIADGQLSLLRDRTVESVQRVPTWVDERDLKAILPGHYAITLGEDSRLALIGTDGRELDVVKREGWDVDVIAGSLTTAWPWLIVRFGLFTPTLADDVGETETAYELWLPGDPAAGIAGRRFPLPRIDARVEGVRASPTGRYALVYGQQLRRLDPSTGVSTLIEPAFRFYQPVR